ncbi:histidine phosphatase family protein [Meridianimaribacter sp. CL38]|uniref:SixA phosphatase family protein n=1 Tax=Meridianimaribacter sp. CL38 TaxID=2213021 RepID=UPI00103D4704|nr:histidine phosphatase family protein [Meridianimaribacter sp. CL38]TBV26477.1 histidine phosphatase family protein [Meridianimaribacter sp. CL38]
MKQILFIRHAKSSWEYDVSDIDRPLNSRGLNDADLMSNHFKSYKIRPDIVFSSPANRALTTCKIFLKTLNIDENRLVIDTNLYDFGGQMVMDFIKSVDDTHSCIMVFGHNHAFTTLVNELGDQFIGNLPTCGLAKIDFDTDQWSKINKGHTDMLLFPKELKS